MLCCAVKGLNADTERGGSVIRYDKSLFHRPVSHAPLTTNNNLLAYSYSPAKKKRHINDLLASYELSPCATTITLAGGNILEAFEGGDMSPSGEDEVYSISLSPGMSQFRIAGVWAGGMVVVPSPHTPPQIKKTKTQYTGIYKYIGRKLRSSLAVARDI
ncbi:hypothetical protein BU17DRAFT_68050 [Hysterangium stoloniferum]|nr:hypothetical protein BU17DRAFT_68050 [Hysterangium stoloniferum]